MGGAIIILVCCYSEYGENPEEAVRQCQQLLNEPHLDRAVRPGDVYALLIEHHTQTGDYKQVSYE